MFLPGLKNEIEIMSSLQRPKKFTAIGDDGQEYSFLCKPKDDLRKDARLMEFNSVINKLLKKDSESRKRHLGTCPLQGAAEFSHDQQASALTL